MAMNSGGAGEPAEQGDSAHLSDDNSETDDLAPAFLRSRRGDEKPWNIGNTPWEHRSKPGIGWLPVGEDGGDWYVPPEERKEPARVKPANASSDLNGSSNFQFRLLPEGQSSMISQASHATSNPIDPSSTLMKTKAIPKVNQVTPLSSQDAKWVELQKIHWTDEANNPRTWEACSRKTRGTSGVDAVAIAAILRHPANPPATIIVLQFRPPVGKICVELPAGLVDKDETVEQAAIRELKEETGYEGKLVEMSPVLASNPGSTTSNMQLATVILSLNEGDEEPKQKLDEGEFVERKIVPLKDLYQQLVHWDQEGCIVSAPLWHWAAGLRLTKMMV